MDQQDRIILRDLAKKVAAIAALPETAARRQLWKQHNQLEPVRPLLLVFPEGAWEELLPAASLQCREESARWMERDLRQRLYACEHFQSDNVVEAEWIVNKTIRSSGWGLEPRRRPSTAARGSWAFEPVLQTPADLKKLRIPEISYDAAQTERNLAAAQELFGDILTVKLKGISHLSYHLMQQYTALRGLEQMMLDMYEQPDLLHDAMAFFEEGHQSILRQYEAQNLLSLNNDNTYHSSGGVGYTDALPRPGFDPRHVRPADMWASAEAQELALVSPAQHEEFSLRYERRLLAPFGLNGYGCCEDLSRKLDAVLTIPNIRRISIAPSADVDRCAERLQGRAIFSWKPNPAHLVGDFNPERVRAMIRHTIEVAAANGCVLEIILKDTHTCEQHPERFDQWTQVARELVETAG